MSLPTLKPSEIWNRVRHHLRPPPQESLSQWIERVVRLPQGLAAEPGPVTLWPYQRAIADSIGDPNVERVTFLKSVRSGYTFLISAAVARLVLDDPCPIIGLMPTLSDTRDYIVSDLEPTFSATPELRGLLAEPQRHGEDRSTLAHRIFPGGSLKVLPAKAPRNLRRHTARVVMADEIDAYKSVEGDVIRLAERRTMTFSNRKLVAGSSPKVEDTSLICKRYEQSDQRVFEILCQHCHSYFELLWRHIEWESERPDTAHAICPECGSVITEGDKCQAVENGRWRATKPEVLGHHGYRINALVSLLPAASWAELAREFLSAKDDSDLLRAFTTTLLAEAWKEAAVTVDDSALKARAEPISLDDIPPEVLLLTCGVDCQDDRLEASVVGFTKTGDALVLDHQLLWGSPTDASGDVWKELDTLLRQRWPSKLGGQLRIDACCVDGGDGDHYDSVLAFCTPRLSRRVFCTKGVAGPGKPLITRSRGRQRALFLVGADTAKGQILSRLERGRTIRFSDALDEAYFTQLCSERRIVRMSRGRPVVRFERVPGYRAEALDCLALAFAARAALRLDLDARADELRAPTPAPPRSGIIRSKWMEQGRL